MSASLRQHHHQVLQADTALLQDHASSVTPADLTAINEHLTAYQKDLGRKDFWEALSLLFMECALLCGVIAGSFLGLATLIGAALGKGPVLDCTYPVGAATLCFLGLRASYRIHQKRGRARNTASTLRFQMGPLSRYYKGEVHRMSRSEPVAAYVERLQAQSTAQGLELKHFHYQAVYRFANPAPIATTPVTSESFFEGCFSFDNLFPLCVVAISISLTLAIVVTTMYYGELPVQNGAKATVPATGPTSKP